MIEYLTGSKKAVETIIILSKFEKINWKWLKIAWILEAVESPIFEFLKVFPLINWIVSTKCSFWICEIFNHSTLYVGILLSGKTFPSWLFFISLKTPCTDQSIADRSSQMCNSCMKFMLKPGDLVRFFSSFPGKLQGQNRAPSVRHHPYKPKKRKALLL